MIAIIIVFLEKPLITTKKKQIEIQNKNNNNIKNEYHFN
jgi:hypothetical protein